MSFLMICALSNSLPVRSVLHHGWSLLKLVCVRYMCLQSSLYSRQSSMSNVCSTVTIMMNVISVQNLRLCTRRNSVNIHKRRQTYFLKKNKDFSWTVGNLRPIPKTKGSWKCIDEEKNQHFWKPVLVSMGHKLTFLVMNADMTWIP